MTMYMRQLGLDFSISEIEVLAEMNNRFSDGPIIAPLISAVNCLGVSWVVTCLVDGITNDDITDDGERTCLRVLDKVKNALRQLGDDRYNQPLNVDGEIASTETRCAIHDRLNCGTCC